MSIDDRLGANGLMMTVEIARTLNVPIGRVMALITEYTNLCKDQENCGEKLMDYLCGMVGACQAVDRNTKAIDGLKQLVKIIHDQQVEEKKNADAKRN